MLLVQMVHDKFLGLIKLWRLGKLKQTDSALFWLLREPHVQSGNFILHYITYFTSAEDDFYHLMFISKMLHHVFIKFKQIVYHSLVAW